MGFDIDKIASYAQWGFVGLMVLCVGVGIIVGMARGWKKATLAVSLTILSIILAAALAPLFYKTVLNFDLGIFGIHFEDGSESLYAWIENYANGFLTENGIAPDAALLSLIITISSVVVNLVVFLLLFLLLSLMTKAVIYPILKLIFLKRERAAKRELRRKGFETRAPKKRRLIGMGIGAVQGLAITLALLVPFAAAANTADAAHKALDQEAVAVLKDDEGFGKTLADIDAILSKISDAYRKSVPGAVFSGLGLDKLIYGGLTTVNADGNKITLEGTALIAAAAANLPLKFMALQKQTDAINADGTLNAGEKEAAFKNLYDGFLDYFRNGFVETIFESGLAVVLIEGAARSVNAPQTVAPAALVNDIGGNGALGESVKSVFAELKTDPAKKLKAELIGLIFLIEAVNEDGLLYNLFNREDGLGGILDVLNYTDSLVPKVSENLKKDDVFLLRELIVFGRNSLIDMMGGGGYISREDVDWETEAEALFGENGAFKALLANYGVLFVDGEINFGNALLNESQTTSLGGALDDFFRTELFKDVKSILYEKYLSEALSGAAGGIIDMSKVDLTRLNFKALLPVLFRGYDLYINYAEWMDENYRNPDTGDLDRRERLASEFGKFIDAVEGLEYCDPGRPAEKDPSGIIRQFCKLTEDVIAEMGISSKINKEYFAEKENQIDITANRAPIVELIRLSARVKGMAGIVSSAAAGADHGDLIASGGRIKDIQDALEDFDVALKQGTPAFQKMAKIVLNDILGSDYPDPLGSLIESCGAYITMLKLLEVTEGGGGVNISLNDIENLIDILYDDDIFKVTKDLLGDNSIDGIVDDTNRETIENVIKGKMIGADQNTVDKLSEIARLLGITL